MNSKQNHFTLGKCSTVGVSNAKCPIFSELTCQVIWWKQIFVQKESLNINPSNQNVHQFPSTVPSSIIPPLQSRKDQGWNDHIANQHLAWTNSCNESLVLMVFWPSKWVQKPFPPQKNEITPSPLLTLPQHQQKQNPRKHIYRKCCPLTPPPPFQSQNDWERYRTYLTGSCP